MTDTLSQVVRPILGVHQIAATPFTGSRQAAKRRLSELIVQRDAGLAPSPEKTTVADWFRGWLVRHAAEGHLNEHGRERYSAIIERHIVPRIGRLTLKQLRGHHVADLKARWLETLAPATVYKHLVVVRQALDEAVASNRSRCRLHVRGRDKG